MYKINQQFNTSDFQQFNQYFDYGKSTEGAVNQNPIANLHLGFSAPCGNPGALLARRDISIEAVFADEVCAFDNGRDPMEGSTKVDLDYKFTGFFDNEFLLLES